LERLPVTAIASPIGSTARSAPSPPRPAGRNRRGAAAPASSRAAIHGTSCRRHRMRSRPHRPATPAAGTPRFTRGPRSRGASAPAKARKPRTADSSREAEALPIPAPRRAAR
jgi:hypothetical protein